MKLETVKLSRYADTGLYYISVLKSAEIKRLGVTTDYSTTYEVYVDDIVTYDLAQKIYRSVKRELFLGKKIND